MAAGFNWGAWALLGSANQTINAASSLIIGEIDNSDKVATELSVQLTYAASSTLGANIQIERDLDGTNYESETSLPWTIPMPFVTNTSKERVITIPADMVGKFRVRIVNLSTATYALTNVTVRSRQCVHVTV